MSIFAGIAAGANLYVQQAVDKKKTMLEQQLEAAKEARAEKTKVAEEDRAHARAMLVVKDHALQKNADGTTTYQGINEEGNVIPTSIRPALQDEIDKSNQADQKEKAAIDETIARTGYYNSQKGYKDEQTVVLPQTVTNKGAVDASRIRVNDARAGLAGRQGYPKPVAPLPAPSQAATATALVAKNKSVIAGYVRDGQLTEAQAAQAAVDATREAVAHRAKTGAVLNIQEVYLATLRGMIGTPPKKGK